MWAVGLASNIWHDETLLNIRRKPKSTVSQTPAGPSKNEQEGSRNAKPHYAIPYGGLYALISFPNYFSEWFEWLGFAISASALTAQLPATHVVFPFAAGRLAMGMNVCCRCLLSSL
jgi:3-oxo-5-alpha-steroid 4-dehydrogenase 1